MRVDTNSPRMLYFVSWCNLADVSCPCSVSEGAWYMFSCLWQSKVQWVIWISRCDKTLISSWLHLFHGTWCVFYSRFICSYNQRSFVVNQTKSQDMNLILSVDIECSDCNSNGMHVLPFQESSHWWPVSIISIALSQPNQSYIWLKNKCANCLDVLCTVMFTWTQEFKHFAILTNLEA